MHLWLKIPWSLLAAFCAVSLIWFVLGSTANFQRSIDLVRTIILVAVAVPLFVFTILSVYMLAKGWAPSTRVENVGLYSGFALMLILSLFLFRNVNTEGWLTEKVTSDSIKITEDQKYEYRLELINLFQKNSGARLYVRPVNSKKVISIPLDIQTERIVGLGIKKVNNWVIMKPTQITDQYTLYTTEELGILQEKFEIDIEKGISEKLQ